MSEMSRRLGLVVIALGAPMLLIWGYARLTDAPSSPPKKQWCYLYEKDIDTGGRSTENAPVFATKEALQSFLAAAWVKDRQTMLARLEKVRSWAKPLDLVDLEERDGKLVRVSGAHNGWVDASACHETMGP